jgi:hypothetical protein
VTAREAYDTDPTFRALVDEWVRERRCPLVLVDRCLDFDMPAAAECARWAATEPKREVFVAGFRGEPTSHPFPCENVTVPDERWYWCVARSQYYANEVEPRRVGKPYETYGFKTAPDAVLWLLDNWVPEDARA